jgi:hypothetical protein
MKGIAGKVYNIINMSTYNFRYAQTQNVAAPPAFNQTPGNTVAQSPGSYNNAQQNATPTTAPQQVGNTQQQAGQTQTGQSGTAQQQVAEQQAQMKQVMSTWFSTVMDAKQSIINYGRLGISVSRNPAVTEFVKNQLPSLLRFNVLEEWLTNALTKRYDVIFNNLKNTNLGKIATNPEIQELAKELSDQMTRSVGRKLGVNGQQYLDFMQKLKAAKASKPYNVLNTVSKVDDLLIGLTEAEKAFKTSNIFADNSIAQAEAIRDFESAIPELKAAQQALLDSQTADDIVKNTENLENILNKNKYLFQFIEERKFLGNSFISTFRGTFGRETGIAAAATNTIEQAISDSRTAKNAVQMAAKLGKDPTAARKAAVESLNIFKSVVMKVPALKGLVTALEFIGKNLPIIDLLLSSADYYQFIDEMRTNKVNLYDPEHPEYIPLFIFSSFKLLLSVCMVVAPVAIPVLAPFDILISAAQFLTPGIQQAASKWLNADTDEIQRISEQAAGTPPSNPDAKIVYDWIIDNGFKKSITDIVLQDPKKNWNMLNEKWANDAINTFLNKASGNIIDKAHAKALFGQISWLTEQDDTRLIELKQSLLGLSMSIVKAARQEAAQQNITPYQQNIQEYYNQQRQNTSNKFYNNRRYVTCPST